MARRSTGNFVLWRRATVDGGSRPAFFEAELVGDDGAARAATASRGAEGWPIDVEQARLMRTWHQRLFDEHLTVGSSAPNRRHDGLAAQDAVDDVGDVFVHRDV